MAYFIGVDVGTSSIKATLADEWGSVVISAVRSYSCSHPHSGWSEQDPQDWCDAAIFAVRELVSLPEVDPSAVKGLSFGGQMHGLVVLDATDEIIRPAILWNDGRSTKECAYLNEVIGREKITQWCGNIAFPGFTAPKLLWMREHEPEFFSRIAKVMLPKDYLAYRFTGAFCTDVSDASGTLLFDVRHRIWSRPMIELVGLQDGQLPDVCESWEVIGTLLPEVAKRMGLSPSVCVAAGAGDNAAAAVGMGCVSEGQCNVSLGTSGTVFLPTQAMRLDAKNALHSFADATGAYHLMGCILSAASANDWWVKGILGSDVGRELSRIEVDLLGRNRVLFLPYLMGERSPINDAGARAAFVGMDLGTTRPDMVQAVLEGVTFALRQSIDAATSAGIEVKHLTACGGGAQSPVWRQMMANVLGMPVSTHGFEGGPSYGACLLAMVGCGVYPSVSAAVRAVVVQPTECAVPTTEVVERYEDRYRVFCSLYPALKDVFALVKGDM